MAGFDPDKFLADTAPKEASAPAFDPDKFLAETAPTNPKLKKTDWAGGADAAMRGGAQGALLGFPDEAYGLLGAVVNPTNSTKGFVDRYHEARDYARGRDTAAEAAHPNIYTAGQVGGGIATAFVPGLGAINIGKGAGAAEILGKGAAMGATAGAGNAENFTDVPEEALKGGVVGAAASGGLALLGKGIGAVARNVGPVAAKIFAGTDEGNLAKYIAGKDRINAVGALPEEAVKDSIDSGVANVLGDRDALATRAKDLEGVMNQAYAQKHAELVGSVTPLTKAKEMTASLASQKAYLGSLSEQADDALVRSGAVFKKADLLRSVDKIGTGQGAAIGDEAHSALSKLQSTRDRIAEQLPDEIPAVQMRDVLQQLRKDVSFDQGAGEFNDTLNGMRKEFSGQISNALKKQVPEYAQYMSRMSDLADNLGTMNRYFGDESKALGSLETLRKGGARAQLIQDALQSHATVNSDQSMLGHLDQINQNHALLSRINAGEDMRPHLFPRAWNALQEAQAEAQMAGDVAAPVERLGQNRTQAVIRNAGGKIPNIEDRRALEALSQTQGQNYPQMIDDKNVFDSFGKGMAPTGRNATMMSTALGGLGYLLHGPTGAAMGVSAGGLIGGTLDRYAPAIVKGTTDSTIGLKTWLSSTEGVQRLGPYARPLLEAAAKGNQTLAAVNQTLIASDPLYRSIFSPGPQQQKRNAINRRLSE